jgi:outer membrane protein TolC
MSLHTAISPLPDCGRPRRVRQRVSAFVFAWLLAAPALWAQQTPVQVPASAPKPDGGLPSSGEARSAAAAAPELSLPEAIRTALDNNRTVGISRRRIGIAEDRLKEAKSGDWPRATLDASTVQRELAPVVHFPGVPAPIPQGDKYTWLTRTALVLPLTDFGRTSGLKEAAEFGVEAAQLSSERAEQDIVLQVSQAYYRVLQTEKIRQVVLDSIASVQLQLRDAKAFFAQGLVSNSDVLSAEVRLAERQQDLITAEANVQVAAATLNRIMGQDLGRPVKLRDVSGRPTWDGSYDALVRQAHDDRADLKASRLQIHSSEAELRAARAENYPRLNAYAEYDTNSTSLFVHKEWMQSGFLLSMTIFSGGQQSASVARKQKEVLEAQDQFLERQDNISLDVKQAFLAAGQSRDSVSVADKNQQLATENLRIFRDRYTQGLVTSTDVLTAEDTASRARSGYYQALYDFHAQLARLDNAVGRATKLQ